MISTLSIHTSVTELPPDFPTHQVLSIQHSSMERTSSHMPTSFGMTFVMVQ